MDLTMNGKYKYTYRPPLLCTTCLDASSVLIPTPTHSNEITRLYYSLECDIQYPYEYNADDLVNE